MEFLQNRIRRVVEGLMENESLAEGLETSAAQALLDWGISLAQGIAASTGDLDDEAAEEAMYPRLKAMRKLMRSVGQWVAGSENLSEEDRFYYWNKILENAGVLYGEQIETPSEEHLREMSARATPAEVITLLREKFEFRPGGEHA